MAKRFAIQSMEFLSFGLAFAPRETRQNYACAFVEFPFSVLGIWLLSIWLRSRSFPNWQLTGRLGSSVTAYIHFQFP